MAYQRAAPWLMTSFLQIETAAVILHVHEDADQAADTLPKREAWPIQAPVIKQAHVSALTAQPAQMRPAERTCQASPQRPAAFDLPAAYAGNCSSRSASHTLMID